MSSLSYVLPALACPVAMGGMMWMMMRSGQGNATSPSRLRPPTGLHGSDDATELEIERLQAELDAVRANPDPGDWGGRGVAASADPAVPADAEVGSNPA